MYFANAVRNSRQRGLNPPPLLTFHARAYKTITTVIVSYDIFLSIGNEIVHSLFYYLINGQQLHSTPLLEVQRC